MRFDSLMKAAGAALILAVAVACSGAGGPQGGNDAAGAVRTFYDHLNAGRYDDAKTLYTAEARQQIFPDADATEGFQNWAIVETHNRSLTEFNVVSETEAETGITIQFELRFEGGESSQRRVTVSEEDGDWRLGFIG
jgi:hypothetical protein